MDSSNSFDCNKVSFVCNFIKSDFCNLGSLWNFLDPISQPNTNHPDCMLAKVWLVFMLWEGGGEEGWFRLKMMGYLRRDSALIKWSVLHRTEQKTDTENNRNFNNSWLNVTASIQLCVFIYDYIVAENLIQLYIYKPKIRWKIWRSRFLLSYSERDQINA